MKTYTILYAEDIPHYGIANIEAATDSDAIEQAMAYDYGDVDLEADWNCASSHKRIVHIAGPNDEIVLEDAALDTGSG